MRRDDSRLLRPIPGLQLALATAVALSLACRDETPLSNRTLPPGGIGQLVNYCAPPQNLKSPTNTDEPELFGSVFVNGTQTNCSYAISLGVVQLQGILYGGTVLSEDTDPRYSIQFGWWDPDQNGGCAATSVLAWESNGATNQELHGAGGVTGPPWGAGGGQGLERHCIRPGKYTFQATGPAGTRSFDVEYLQAQGGLVDSVSGTPLYLEQPYTRTGPVHDLVVNVDMGSPPAGSGDTPVLTAQSVTLPADPANPQVKYVGSSAVTGDANTGFRFSLHGSSWTNDITWFTPRGRVLAKLFWDATASPSDATGYYSVDAYGPPLVRVRRFPNPTTAQRVYSVALDLKRPAEAAVTTPPPGLVTVTINRIYPDLAPGVFTVPAYAGTGQALGVTLPERNLTATASGSVEAGWQGRLYLSSNATLEVGSDSLVGTFTQSVPQPPGTTKTFVRTINIPAAMPTGSYYVLAHLDATNVILETTSGEANNVGASTATVSVAPITLGSPVTFSKASCYITTVASKVYANYGVAWSGPPQPSGTVYEIAQAGVNNPAQAVVIRSRASTIQTDTLTNYRVIPTAPPRYVWVRHRNGSSTTAWLSLAENPLLPAEGCGN